MQLLVLVWLFFTKQHLLNVKEITGGRGWFRFFLFGVFFFQLTRQDPHLYVTQQLANKLRFHDCREISLNFHLLS